MVSNIRLVENWLGEQYSLSFENSKVRSKKEVTIALRSKPLVAEETKPIQSMPQTKHKPRDARRKGTRGVSWIG